MENDSNDKCPFSRPAASTYLSQSHDIHVITDRRTDLPSWYENGAKSIAVTDWESSNGLAANFQPPPQSTALSTTVWLALHTQTYWSFIVLLYATQGDLDMAIGIVLMLISCSHYTQVGITITPFTFLSRDEVAKQISSWLQLQLHMIREWAFILLSITATQSTLSLPSSFPPSPDKSNDNNRMRVLKCLTSWWMECPEWPESITWDCY